ncbi:MAG: (d)CMP kinase [Alphaproteobacteria bacterium]|nr:(d)CMP kinase [Alphaproteobacteria bacterium]OJV14162.1 MAG: cytidylate kinase [Alphaproteobacteria bacterium 33-17]
MKKNKKLLITIDGPSASGKGTVAKLVASKLGLGYLDSGLIYRELAYQITQKNFTLETDWIELSKNLDLGQINNHIKELKTEEIGSIASKAAAVTEIRKNLLDIQRKFYEDSPSGIVADGRDMGTVVFPDADFKFFVTAGVGVRADRRFKELQLLNKNVIYDQVVQDLINRDNRDSSRDCAPLKAAEGAITIDTTTMPAEEAATIIIDLILS